MRLGREKQPNRKTFIQVDFQKTVENSLLISNKTNQSKSFVMSQFEILIFPMQCNALNLEVLDSRYQWWINSRLILIRLLQIYKEKVFTDFEWTPLDAATLWHSHGNEWTGKVHCMWTVLICACVARFSGCYLGCCTIEHTLKWKKMVD